MANFIIWSGTDIVHSVLRTGGAYQVASWLRQYGYTVQVVDFGYNLTGEMIAEITEKYIDKDTYAIGVSATFWNLDVIDIDNVRQVVIPVPKWARTARQKIESKYPNIEWILGGASANAVHSKMKWLRMPDYAEDKILKYFDEKSGNKIIRPNFDIKNYVRKYTETDFVGQHEVLTLELGRGCIFKCKFCSYPYIGKKKGTYVRSYSDLKDEVMYNYERWGVTKYYYTDDTVNDDEDKLRDLVKLKNSVPFDLEWLGFLRADLLWAKPHTVDMLEESGLKTAFFGIETFNPYSAKLIGKSWSGTHAKDYLLELKEKWGDRINWHLGLILGLPGWTYSELEKDMDWLITNNMHRWKWWSLYINPVSGKIYQSEFDRDYTKYGISFRPNNQINWEYKNLRHDQLRLAALHANEWCDPHCSVGGWLVGELSTTYKKSMAETMQMKLSDVSYEHARETSRKLAIEYASKHV